MLYTAPAFSMVMARIILIESLTIKKIAALILTFIGVILVMEAYRPGQLALNIPGVIAGIASGFTYGVYSIFIKGAIRRGYGTLETVIIALGTGLLALSFIHPPWRLMPFVGAPFMLWVFVVAVAVFCTMLPYVFFVSGLIHVEAGSATLVAAIEPVVAILMAIAFLGETLTILQCMGVVAVLAAIRGQLD
jgi:drug/metabolite transporter (DMT)-like permease